MQSAEPLQVLSFSQIKSLHASLHEPGITEQRQLLAVSQ